MKTNLLLYGSERFQKDSIAWTQAMSEKTLIEQIDKMKKRKEIPPSVYLTQTQAVALAFFFIF